MGLLHWLPLASSLVIVLFAWLIFHRYGRRGGMPLLAWGIGLAMFGAASLAEAYSTWGWHPVVFRLWYLCGAILTAAWLGQGTVFLLSRRLRLAWILFGLLVVGSLIATYLVFRTPLDGARFTARAPLSAQYREILPAGATERRLTPLFNIYGLSTLVGGALYSAWRLYRTENESQRVVGNILIALGGLVLGFASTLVRLGLADYLSVAELLAAVSMFAGFLFSTVWMPVPVPGSVPVQVSS